MGYREWLAAQPRSRSPRTINKAVGILHNMLAKGVKWGRIATNPLAGLAPLRHDNPVKQRRALTVDEVQRLFDASPEHLKPVWRAFMTTGIRKRELVELRFADVDLDRQVLTIRAANAKSKGLT